MGVASRGCWAWVAMMPALAGWAALGKTEPWEFQARESWGWKGWGVEGYVEEEGMGTGAGATAS